MFLLDESSNFKPLHKPKTAPKIGDYLFIYKDKQLALTKAGELPCFDASLVQKPVYGFGELEGRACLLWALEDTEVPYQWVESRLSFKTLQKPFYSAVALGSHLYHFRQMHRYCGKCASLLVDQQDEQALLCVACSQVVYPKISPCVIVLITRGTEVLLARSPHFAPQVMSTIAGFIELGESAEQTVRREVKEEVGIEVGHLKYICSQPWPFPDSLMLGFTAEYLKGDISIDPCEIEAAAWFHKDNLPPLPNQMSIARYLIDQHFSKAG